MSVDPMIDCCQGRYEDLFGYEYASDTDLKVSHRCRTPEMKCAGCANGYYSTRIWYDVQEDGRVRYSMITDCEDCSHEFFGEDGYIDADEFATIENLSLRPAPSWDDIT
jgi:hypothetical protein